MKNLNKNIIYIIITIILFVAIGILLFFKFGNNSPKKDYNAFFKSFSAGLAELGIENTELFIDVEGFDVIEARSYRSNEGKTVTIYILDKKSSNFKSIVKNKRIVNKENPDLVVDGSDVIGEYFYYLEEGFPKDYDVYDLFKRLASE